MFRGIRSPLFGLISPIGRVSGGAITPVLSAFGAGSTDDLELDPPAIIIEHNTGGTLTGDFHSSATPPAKEAGDIGFFTTTLSGDDVTDISTALNTFLDANPGETGYLHFRLTNGAVDSNVITTQEITTAPIWATVTGTTGSPTFHADVDGDGEWDAYEFTASGSITLTDGLIGRRLWQGGGGCGGTSNDGRGAGGGGGGWTQVDDTNPSISAGTYTVTIGAGGAKNPNRFSDANPGGDTTAFSITALGGGKGGAGDSFSAGGGGNGGGGRGSLSSPFTGGVGSPGNDGGDGVSTIGGGGGGSGSAGQDATASSAGNGGSGVNSDILGSSINFGAGGGGTSAVASGYTGSAGGSSASAGALSGPSSNATANRGGGSGGVSSALSTDTSGAGGSGVFIIRIKRAA